MSLIDRLNDIDALSILDASGARDLIGSGEWGYCRPYVVTARRWTCLQRGQASDAIQTGPRQRSWLRARLDRDGRA